MGNSGHGGLIKSDTGLVTQDHLSDFDSSNSNLASIHNPIINRLECYWLPAHAKLVFVFDSLY